MTARLPDDEQGRLAALHEHRLLDTPPEEDFDGLVRLAAQVCGVPIAAVTLVDADRQWFKAILGLDITGTPRDAAFCAHTLLQPDLLVVPDAQADARFADNPLVTGAPDIRFYAGAPLLTDDGHALGSLCVIDRVPRTLTPDQETALRLLGRQAAALLRAARRVAERGCLAAEKERLAAERELLLAEQERLLTDKERLLAGREAAEAERLRLAAIVETCEDAIYSRTLGGTVTSWNAGAERLYGYSAAEIIGRPLALIVPPDRHAELAGLLTTVVRDGRAEPLETVRLTKSGAAVDVSLRVSPITDGAGAVVGASMIAHDITARKQAEAALTESHAELAASHTALAESSARLRESEERLRRLGDAAFEGIAVSQDGVVIDASETFAALFGYPCPADVIGLPGGTLAAPESRVLVASKIAACDENPYEAILQRRDGSTFAAELRGRLIQVGGRPARITAVRDVTERKRAEALLRDHAVILEFQKSELEKMNAELAALATTDGLTGLKNHRAFQERLGAEVGRAGRYGTPLSLILLDVDHFKGYNDTHGHPAGDAVLRTVARLLQECARDIDLVARYGGEEFGVILPQTDLSGAAVLAERIRAALSAHPWPLRPVTASFGAAALRPGDEGGGDLIARADAALYRAKAAGRDCVTCASELPAAGAGLAAA